MKYKITALICLLSVMSIHSYAAVENISVTADIENSTVIISGSADSEQNLCIDIFKPGKSYEDFADDTVDHVLAYRKLIKADKDGAFLQTVRLLDGAGKYSLRITSEDAVCDGMIYYTTKNDFEEAVSILNSATETNIGEMITQYATALGWNNRMYNEVSKNAVASKILSALKVEKLDASDPESVRLLFDKIVILQAVNENKSVDIGDLTEYFSLSESFCDEWKTRLDEAALNIMYKALLSGTYNSEKSFIEKYEELVFLSCIQNMNGYEGVAKIVAAYSAKYDLGINLTDYNSLSAVEKKNVNNDVLGKNFSSYQTFAAVYNELIKQKRSSTNSYSGVGGGSSGGGGSTGGGVKDVRIVASVQIPEETIQQQPVSRSVVFSDIDNYTWAEEAIMSLYSQGVIDGIGNDLFEPEAYVTREQFVKMIVCANDAFDTYAECEFEDVSKDSWSYKYIASAVSSGIIKGISKTTFGYGEPITREDAAVIIDRVMGEDSAVVYESVVFADETDISDYAYDSVYALVKQGVVSGIGNNMFAPKAYCRRCEAAQIIYNSLKK